MIEVAPGELPQVSPLGQELAHKAVGVLVRAALPRRMGIAKPDVDLQALRELRVSGHLDTPVEGEAPAQEAG